MKKYDELLVGSAVGFAIVAIFSLPSYLMGGDLIKTVFETGIFGLILLIILPLVFAVAVREAKNDYDRIRRMGYFWTGLPGGAIIAVWLVRFIRLIALPGIHVKSVAIYGVTVEPTGAAWILGLLEILSMAVVAAHYQDKVEEIRRTSAIMEGA